MYEAWAAMTKYQNTSFSIVSWPPFFHLFITRFLQVLTFFRETPFFAWRCPKGH